MRLFEIYDISEIVAIFDAEAFLWIVRMKDVKYPKKVWIDLIYRDSIWLVEHTRWKEGAPFLLYMSWLIDQSERVFYLVLKLIFETFFNFCFLLMALRV